MTKMEGKSEGGVTLCLVLSVTVSCLGNSFLYGYQIGVVNQPADIIQEFYSKTYYERHEKSWDNMLKYNEYLQDENITTAEAIIKYNLSKISAVPLNVSKLSPAVFDAHPALLLEPWEVKILWSTTVAAFVLFGMIGAFMSAKVADFFGRQRGMIVITPLMFIAAILGGITMVAKSPECLILSRVLVGLHSGINITLCPLYLAEISPRRIRGAFGVCHQLACTIGILVSMILGLKQLFGTEDLWYWLFAFNAVPSILCLTVMPFLPESPRFLLIKKGNEEQAKKALIRLRGTKDVDSEMDEMRLEAGKSVSIKNFTLKELLITRELRMPLIIACVLQIGQQWSGINAVMSYSAMLFKQVNIDFDLIPFLVVATGAVNVIFSIVTVPLMEKLGRRPLLLFPMIGMLISFIVMMVFLNLGKHSELKDHHLAFALVCIAAMHTAIIGFALGLGPIPFIVVGEIFRQEPRAAAMSLSLAFNWVCNFLLMITFPFLRDGMEEFMYLLFSAVLALTIVFVFFFVPETKNKTFDEIANSISLGGRAKSVNKTYEVHSEETVLMTTSKI